MAAGAEVVAGGIGTEDIGDNLCDVSFGPVVKIDRLQFASTKSDAVDAQF